MDDTASDTTLIVCEREYLVNRKRLIESSSYFRAMFEGGFKESNANRVELKGISDADAFAVLLDYILNKRVDLKAVEENMKNALALCDMLGLDEFLDFFKQEFLKKFSDLKTAESILLFSEKFNLRPSLWFELLSFLRNIFKEKGRRSSKECDVSVVDESPDLIADILGTEDKNNLCFWDVEKDASFGKGLSSWILDHKFPPSTLRKLVRCFGVLCIDKYVLFKMIDEEEKSRDLYTLKPEVNRFISDTEDCFRNYGYRLCVGSFGPNAITMFQFNFGNCNWSFFRFDRLLIKRSGSLPITTTNSMKVDTYYWYMSPDDLGYCFFDKTGVAYANLTGDSSPIYTSVQHTSSGVYHLLIFELKNKETDFSEIFRTDVPGPILGCQLLRLEDVLHGFLTYEMGSKRYTVCYFALYRNSEYEIWSTSDFRFEPLLSDIKMKYIPAVLASPAEGYILVFLGNFWNIFLAEYNIENKYLRPLWREGMPCFQLQMTCEAKGYNQKHDEKYRKVCTVTLTCCSGTRSPIYDFFPAAGNGVVYSTARFLDKYDDCAKNENHIPQIKTIIHICEAL